MSSSITPLHGLSPAHLGTERRSGERIVLEHKAILRFQDSLKVLQGTVSNISIGGAGFICHQAVAQNVRCTLQFDLPAVKNIPVQAITVRVIVLNSMQVVGQANHFRINLQFIDLPPKARSHIEGIIMQSLARR